jgi:hypothetical protein
VSKETLEIVCAVFFVASPVIGLIGVTVGWGGAVFRFVARVLHRCGR